MVSRMNGDEVRAGYAAADQPNGQPAGTPEDEDLRPDYILSEMISGAARRLLPIAISSLSE
jgi:hypothetical protein